MTDLSLQGPILFLPQKSGAASSQNSEPVKTPRLNGESIKHWLRWATQHREQFKKLLMQGGDARILNALWDATKTLPPNSNLPTPSLSHHQALQVFFDPSTGEYKVEYKYYRNGNGNGIAKLLSGMNGEIDRILNGARLMLIPPDVELVPPQQVLLASGIETVHPKIDYFVPRPGQIEPRGSSVAFNVDSQIRERLLVADLIEEIFDQADEIRESGKFAAVKKDQDGTEWNARLYTWLIFLNWVAQYEGPGAKDILAAVNKLKEPIFGWNSSDTLDLLGFSEEKYTQAHQQALEHFKENFECHDRCLKIPPIKGMILLTKILQWMGITTINVTLRSEEEDTLPNGESATITAHKRQGTWNEYSRLLVHKGEKIEWTELGFKEPPKANMIRQFLEENPQYKVIAGFDNDLFQVKRNLEAFKFAVHVEGDRRREFKEKEVPVGAYSIRNIYDFEKEIKEWWRNNKPILSKKLSQRGLSLADELLAKTEKIYGVAASEYRHDYPEKIESVVNRAWAILNVVTSYPRKNPLRKAFIAHLNKYAQGRVGALERFEGIIDIINTKKSSNNGMYVFVAIRGPKGIVDVTRKGQGEVVEKIQLNTLPSETDLSKIGIPKDVDLENLPQRLADLNSGPRLTRYDHLSFGHYPKMKAALSTVVGALTEQTGKPPHKLTAIEYGPDVAVGAMTLLARMGLKVGWKEIHFQRKVRTQYELQRLPQKLDKGMVYLPSDMSVSADIAIWNRPSPCIDFNTLGQEVVKGGFLVVQSDKNYDGTPGWSLVTSVPVPTRSYVMPSSHLNTVRVPLTFQVWKRI